MISLSHCLLIALIAPLISAAVSACFFRRKPTLAIGASLSAAFVIMAASVGALWQWDGTAFVAHQEWMKLGDFLFSMGFFFDNQAAILLFVVSFVGFWIHVFSVGYMDDDEAKARFFAGLSIFMFSMLGIVLASNLFMLFIFWELVGFSSYLLIAHYAQTDEAAQASKKAFIVNRVGDMGLLAGIIWTWAHFGTTELQELSAIVGANPNLVSAGIALSLMCGFLGKSAQFPLHVWLPDAMAGPTPISALIHAATMVAAGVYFLCRVDFLMPEGVRTLILWLGAGMTLYAGLCALGQRDIKKILAYSTLSQLGYMATAYGLGFPGLALFHLACHAFFKALLFLGAGSVIHACHHEQDIFAMGGLYRKMPITTLTFTIGTLALCAVIGFSGYFSKDAIIEAAYLHSPKAFIVIMGSAFLTSIYMGRLLWVAFFGKANGHGAQQAREGSLALWFPLVILAVLSIFGGLTSLWPTTLSCVFTGELESVHRGIEAAGAHTLLLGLSIAAWAVGLIFTFAFYGPGASSDRLERRANGLYTVLKSKLWIDEIYLFYVGRIQQPFVRFLDGFDVLVFTGLMMRGTAGILGAVGLGLRSLHGGSLHGYVYWLGIGLVVASAYFLGWR